MIRLKKIALAFVVLFILIQFYRPEKNKAATDADKAIAQFYHIPINVDQILKKGCYDCHSNNTQYPWYAEVQPIGWLLNNHIQEGKKQLNFDEFGTYSKKKQKSKLRSIADQIKNDEMPLKSYTRFHKEARINATEKELIFKWIQHLTDSIN